MARPKLRVRPPYGSEADEPCRNCGDTLPLKVTVAGGYTYVLCPLCALELAQDILAVVRSIKRG